MPRVYCRLPAEDIGGRRQGMMMMLGRPRMKPERARAGRPTARDEEEEEERKIDHS